MNLIEVIPENEMKLMNDYYTRYAMGNPRQVPRMSLTDFLDDWNRSKQNLFRMLGNQLIYKIPYTVQKDEEELRNTIKRYITHTDRFVDMFLGYFSRSNFEVYKKINNGILTNDCIYNNRTEEDIELIFEGKKPLKIPKGTKIVRALNKIVEYAEMPENIRQELKVFQVGISMIFNDATIRGNLCLSIHPFDFMTMSDNNSNWNSCMSWQDNGCYKVGSVEMMNANNVICCYLESTKGRMNLISAADIKNHPKLEEQQKKGIWNDKKWRQLLYVNKDILLAGKAYPYKSEKLTLKLLEIAKGLLKDNLGWKYQFGPELYNDMNNTDGLYEEDIDRDISHSMDRASGHRVKKIYFSTKGMYNDMVADHSPIYWCYRNNIKHNKVISLSGKTRCLCCGYSLLTFDEDWCDEDYNGRYIPSGNLYCEDCREIHSCSECGKFYYNEIKEYPVFRWSDTSNLDLCPECAKEIYKCHNCNNNIFFDSSDWLYVPKERMADIDADELNDILDNKCNSEDIKKLCLCRKCTGELIPNSKRTFINSKKSDYNYSFLITTNDKFSGMGYDTAIKYVDLKN